MTAVGVTGASGFLGQHVLAELATREVSIVATTRTAANLEVWRERAQIVEMDISQPAPAQLDALARCDVLVHLAWDGLPNYQSRRHVEVELPRQYGFLRAVIERGAPALLAAGTCLEYGLQSGPLSEESVAQPITPYGFAKDSLRRQLEFLGRDRAFALTWARLFYTYGVGQPATSLYPQLTSAVARGDSSFDMSGGEQLRDYLPVGEVARLLVCLALKRLDAGIVNVCSGNPVSVRRLVETWIKDSGRDTALNLGRFSYPEYEPLAFWGTRSKLERLIGQA